MPAASTHYIFAKETMPLIKDLVDFKIDPRAFYYGTQGPDLYFFHRLLPWQLGKSYRTQGIDLHDRACPTDILNAIKIALQAERHKAAAQFACNYSILFKNAIVLS